MNGRQTLIQIKETRRMITEAPSILP